MSRGMIISDEDFARIMGGGDGMKLSPAAALLPEAVILTLTEHLDRLTSARRPKVGDVVKIRQGIGVRSDLLMCGLGIVAEVLPVDHFVEGCAASHPRRENVRVLVMDSDQDVGVMWVEHWQIMPYDAATEGSSDA